MSTDEHIKSCFSKAAALCSRAEKSPLAINKKLQQWGLDEDEAEQVMQGLFEHDFLNEQRFAISYVRDKYRFNKWGRIKIAYMLKGEGVSGNCISQALTHIDEELYSDNLRKILNDKRNKTKAKDEYELKLKTIQHARSRGFETELIISAYNSLLHELPDN